jgi:hypothetical protein
LIGIGRTLAEPLPVVLECSVGHSSSLSSAQPVVLFSGRRPPQNVPRASRAVPAQLRLARASAAAHATAPVLCIGSVAELSTTSFRPHSASRLGLLRQHARASWCAGRAGLSRSRPTVFRYHVQKLLIGAYFAIRDRDRRLHDRADTVECRSRAPSRFITVPVRIAFIVEGRCATSLARRLGIALIGMLWYTMITTPVKPKPPAALSAREGERSPGKAQKRDS